MAKGLLSADKQDKKKPAASGKAASVKVAPVADDAVAANGPDGGATGAEAGTAKNEDNIGPLGAVVLRNEFYRDGYRTLLRVALMQAAVIVLLIGVIFFVIKVSQAENRYFATTEDGRLIPLVSLSEPNLSTPALMSWVAQAVTETMTFNFNDYKRRLQESSRNFTATGWQSFTSALERAKIIEMIDKKRQVVYAAPQGAPILQQEGIVGDRYQWIVQIPVIVTYEAGNQVHNEPQMITLTVVRVSRLESPSGVGIEQWVAQTR